MIVAGGTTESRAVCMALLAHGYRILFSQATDADFELPPHPRLNSRRGALDSDGWMALIEQSRAVAVVDAAHPHATALRDTLRQVAARLQLPLIRFKRHEIDLDPTVLRVSDHDEAARLACMLGKCILVTVGTRHLAPYVAAARHAQCKLFVRVLEAPESREAIHRLGCQPGEVVFGRGPFTLEQNLELLGKIHAEVIVTKDSGKEGGTVEKIEAAKLLGCKVVVVSRPDEQAGAAETVEDLIEQLQRQLSPDRERG